MIFHMFNKLFTNYNKLEDVNGIKLNKYQLATLKAYKISIEGKTVKQLLKDITKNDSPAEFQVNFTKKITTPHQRCNNNTNTCRKYKTDYYLKYRNTNMA